MRLIDADALSAKLQCLVDDEWITTSITWAAAFDDAKDMVDLAPTMPQWISVEDRLPEEGKFVLVFDSLSRSCDIARCDSKNGLVTGWPEWEDAMITHWMPLPDLPERSGE